MEDTQTMQQLKKQGTKRNTIVQKTLHRNLQIKPERSLNALFALIKGRIYNVIKSVNIKNNKVTGNRINNDGHLFVL